MDNSFTGSRYPGSTYKDTSPLRRSDLPEREVRRPGERSYGGRDNLGLTEEEEYNRRREEEIRKQIQAKDDKIQNLSKASDYLKNRMEPQPQRHNQESMSYSSFGRSLPERDRSPYQQIGAHHQNRDDVSSFGPPPHIKEHISNLQGDNSSLMRRLNLVLQELDRVQKEKDELLDRLTMMEKDQHSLQRLLNGDDKVDKVNRYMQDDLIYERDRNMKLSAQVKSEEAYKNELLMEIRSIEAEQENTTHQNQSMGSDLHKKVSMIQDLEKELYYTQEKIRSVGGQIEQIKRVERDESAEVHELNRLLNSLREERNSILEKLDQLTTKYDECVREISMDRYEIEQHNRRHSKLVTAKLIFQQLGTMHMNKLRQGFLEMRQYCSFDVNCHYKLQGLAKVMQQVGSYKLKIALTQWYSNALNPIGVKLQAQELADKVYSDYVRLRLFCVWRTRYQERIRQYENKNIAVRNLFNFSQNDSKVEIKRSFLIWKDCLLRFKQQKQRVQKLIWKMYFGKLNVAMNTWMNHSANIDTQVRLNLLSKKFSHKQYLTILFHNFKYQISEGKRKKQNILFHVMKAWRDYIRHKKYLMCASIQAMQYGKANDTSILKACFDAMKQHKEQSKYEKVFIQLNDVELQRIGELTNQIDNFDVDTKFKEKNRACQCVKAMMSKQLFEYFNQWKQVNADYKEKLKTTVKDKILKVYFNILRTSFKQWKMQKDQIELTQHQMIVQDYQASHSETQDEVLAITKEITDRKQQRDCTQKKHLHRCVASYERRVLSLAVGRWKDNVNLINTKEDGASTVIKRLRTRLLRQAFDLYVSGIRYKKKLQIEEDRCRYLRETLNLRQKRKIYKAWLKYKQTFQKQKGYWHRLYLRLETTMKERAVKKWQEQTQKLIQHELHQAQDQAVSQIDDLNKHIGELATAEADQNQDIKFTKNRMMKQAQRVLANTFARFYYIGETRGFEKWKEFVQDQKRKEQLMKKMIHHWKKYQFNYVKSAIQNWMKNTDIQEKKEALKREELRLKDAEFQFVSQNKSNAQINEKLNGQLAEITNMQHLYNTKLQKSIKLIVSNVDSKDYMSKKRFILQQWRDYVKREKHFILCVQNVIQKSLWTQGFKHIKQASRDDQRQTQLQTVLNRFRMKFWKRTCGNAFSKWRSGTYSIVTEIIQELESETQVVVEDQHQKRVVIKDHNAVKSGKLIGKGQLKDYFNGWRNVSEHLKIQRVKDEQLRQSVAEMKIKYALQKWSARKDATKLARIRYARLRTKFAYLRKLVVFGAMKQLFNNSKNFMTRMSNLANIHDHQALKMGYNAIQSFVKAKNYVHDKKKEHASRDIYSILSGLLTRRMNSYYNELKYRTNNKYKQNVTKMFAVIHNLSNKTRTYFQRWKENSAKIALQKEMHEEGPIREEVFEQRQILENCKNFMRDEGYGEREIQSVLKGGSVDKKGLLLKGIKRMQHYNEEKYVVPKAFDQWKRYVHLKKLFRYWLNYSNRRAQFVKSDMAAAFDRWKHYDSKHKESYMKLNKKQLDQKTLVNAENLEKLAEVVDDRERIMDHLSNQRDALLENYIKGQKIALCLWRHNARNMLHKAFAKWSHTNQKITNVTFESQVKKNIDLIAAVKERLAQLERDNEAMANENEELRQFSLDGYQIAKNVQVLAGEREKLSVDLADKAQTIRKLLDENEKLHAKLKFAQEEAQSLIKSTNKYMGVTSSTGIGGFTSPHMRSAF